MPKQFFNTSEDVEWLKTTHLKNRWDQFDIKSFILLGNEDCPEAVEAFNVPDPTIHDRPKIYHKCLYCSNICETYGILVCKNCLPKA